MRKQGRPYVKETFLLFYYPLAHLILQSIKVCKTLVTQIKSQILSFVADGPHSNDSMSRIWAAIGQKNVVLHCPVCIYPPYTENDIQWTYENNRLLLLTKRQSGRLVINTVQESHFGTYICALKQGGSHSEETNRFSLHLIKTGEVLD